MVVAQERQRWPAAGAQARQPRATPVTHPAKAVELVSKTLAFSPEQQSTILAHFIKGGQLKTSISCGQCGTPATSRSGRPWCQACEIWLTVCEVTGDWVSYAEAQARTTQARHAQIIETTREPLSINAAEGPST